MKFSFGNDTDQNRVWFKAVNCGESLIDLPKNEPIYIKTSSNTCGIFENGIIRDVQLDDIPDDIKIAIEYFEVNGVDLQYPYAILKGGN